MRVFSAGSYRGATTAEIAREAGVTEPVLYRHFASKRDLYLACLEEAWTAAAARLVAAVIAEVGPGASAVLAIGRTRPRAARAASVLPRRTSGSRRSPRRARTTRSPGYVRAARARGARLRRRHDPQGARRPAAIPADRDADAEAWIFLAGGLLVTFARAARRRCSATRTSPGSRRRGTRGSSASRRRSPRRACGAADTVSARSRVARAQVFARRLDARQAGGSGPWVSRARESQLQSRR